MSHNIRYEMCRALESQIQIGTSKRAERAREAADRGQYQTRTEHIHSRQTVQAYMQQARQYGDWLRDRGQGHCTMDQARDLVRDYLQDLRDRGLSAHTQTLARSALGRVFGCDARDLGDVDRRRGRDITRGRELTDKAERCDRLHPEIGEICRCLGARHGCELDRLQLSQFHREGDDLRCHIVGKGGRERDALVLPGPGRERIERELRDRDPDELLFPHGVPDGTNVHGYRADYAARCYDYALDHGMGNGDFYSPRDGSGRSWDKGALDFVNENLGHGEGRYYTAVYNYLSYGDAKK